MRFLFILLCFFFVDVATSHAAWSPSKRRPAENIQNQKDDGEFTMSFRDMDRWKKSLKRFTELYEQGVKSLKTDPDKFEENVRFLRTYYAQSDYYQPFGEDIVNQMTHFAYIVDTSEDTKEVNDALLEFKAILNTHIVNYDVVSFALMMSRVNVRFGDTEFYKKILKVLESQSSGRLGGCVTPEQACRIITYGEETYLLTRIGGVVKSSKIYQVDPRYYNVHEIEQEDGTTVQIYADVTAPIINTMKTRYVIQKEEESITNLR